MGLLDKLWDDVVAGPQPDRGLGRLRKDPKLSPSPPPTDGTTNEATRRMMDRRLSGEFQMQEEETRRITQRIAIVKPPLLRTTSFEQDGSSSAPTTPTGAASPSLPALGSPGVRERENVWRSVFHPGSNKAMKKLGSEKFDKAQPNSPTVYDWLYSGETKSSWR